MNKETPHRNQLREICFSTQFNRPFSGYGNYIQLYKDKWHYDMITSGCLNCTPDRNAFFISSISTIELPSQQQVFDMICNYYEKEL